MLSKPVWLKAIQQFLRNGKVPEANAKEEDYHMDTNCYLVLT